MIVRSPLTYVVKGLNVQADTSENLSREILLEVKQARISKIQNIVQEFLPHECSKKIGLFRRHSERIGIF